MEKKVLGHIDCPCCGTPNGMRITHDKNGEPFGFCEANCGQQLRVGGSPHRVKEFINRYPWAGKSPVTGTAPNNHPQAGAQVPARVPAPDTGKKPKPTPPKPAEPPVTGTVPIPTPTPAPPKKAASWFDSLQPIIGSK